MILHEHWSSRRDRASFQRVSAVCDWCDAPATERMPVTLGSGEWEAGMLRSRARDAGFVERLDGRVTRLLCPLCTCIFDARGARDA